MPGVGGGVCKSTWSPTPRPRGPFQWATLRPWLSKLTGLILADQPLGKIYSLRQFRHLPAQLFDAFDQFRLIPAGSPGGHGAVPQALRQSFPERGQRNHPGEEAAHGDDRNEQRENVFHQLPRGLASSRSAKSIRSASSATSYQPPWGRSRSS